MTSPADAQTTSVKELVERLQEARRRIEELEKGLLSHQALVDTMHSGVAIYEAIEGGNDFILKSINSAGERISQVTREDEIGRRLREVFPAVDEFGLMGALRSVWHTGTPEHHGPSLYRDERISHWLESDVYRLPSRELMVLYDDVSTRELALAELRASEERFRTLAERLPIGLYRTTTAGQILYVNQALQTMLGYPNAESHLLQRAGVGYVDASERQRFLDVMERDGVCQAFESQWRTWDGRIIWIRESARVVRNPDGVPLYFEGTAEDITEQKAAREAVEQAEERFSRFAEAVSDVIYRYDVRTNRYDFISPAFERLTGYGREELAPDPVRRTRRFVHPGDAKRLYRSLYERFRQGPGKGPFQIDYRIVAKDGRVLWVSDRIDLEFGPDGAIQRMNGVIRDITDLKQAEQEREHLACQLSERVKELNCLSSVSTALGRTEGPLAAIVSAAVTPLPTGMRFPALAAARVVLRGEEASTPGFQPTAWRMEAPLRVNETSEGRVEICYVAAPPPDAGAPFLPEEAHLLEEVAERIGRRVERWDVTEALRASEERYRDLVEKARIGILIDDAQGKFRYFNDTFAAMFGYSREEMSNQTIETIAHPLDLERVVAQHQGRVKGSAPSAHYEFMGIRKDRLPIHVEVDALELRETDHVVGTRSYVWDISERKAAEKERERLIDELKGALAKVKTLSGLLPICANCKRIRDDTGYWQQVETYIHHRSDADFSHGICPDCMSKLYPDYADAISPDSGHSG